MHPITKYARSDAVTIAGDRGVRQGVSMNGAGNIAGLTPEVLPAATVVERMAAEVAARLTAR